MSERGWIACVNCGFPSRPFGDGVSSCLGCFRDPGTGQGGALNAFGSVVILFGVYFLCALVGLLPGMLVGAIVADGMLDMKPGMPIRDLIVVTCSGVSVAFALRLAYRNQMRRGLQGKPPDLPLPPGASPRRRKALLVGCMMIGVCFMFFTFGFIMERYVKGYANWLLVGLVVAGAFGGWLWYQVRSSA